MPSASLGLLAVWSFFPGRVAWSLVGVHARRIASMARHLEEFEGRVVSLLGNFECSVVFLQQPAGASGLLQLGQDPQLPRVYLCGVCEYYFLPRDVLI